VTLPQKTELSMLILLKICCEVFEDSNRDTVYVPIAYHLVVKQAQLTRRNIVIVNIIDDWR
jgi:hypothetical protein